MSETNNGGPAFPTADPNYEAKYAGKGMTLREYFAAKAMEGILTNPYLYESLAPRDGAFQQIAENAFAIADAMLQARGET